MVLCLKAMQTTTILVREADKLMLGQILIVTAPHIVEALVRDATNWWISDAI